MKMGAVPTGFSMAMAPSGLKAWRRLFSLMPAGTEHHVGALQSLFDAVSDAPLIVPHRHAMVQVNADLSQPLGDVGRVGVHDGAQE